jgi:hypothetical protein
VSPEITVLQAPDKDLIQGGSGNNAELSLLGYCLGELPIGYSGAHATLDDCGKMIHSLQYCAFSYFRLS